MKEVINYFAKEKQDKMFQALLVRWHVLKEIAFVLEIPFKANISLQKQSITLSDVFGIWMQMKLHLEAISDNRNFKTKLAKYLVDGLELHEAKIFQNDFMNAALFLDPRYRRAITIDETKTNAAKNTLKQVWRRLNQDANPQPEMIEEPSEVVVFDFDSAAALNEFLNGYSVRRNHQNCENIDDILDAFDPNPIPFEKSILQFWHDQRKEHKELHKLAMAIFSIPPTEVKIERDFSALNFVFTDRRCKLQSERLNDIMTVYTNPQLFYTVKQELIDSLKKSL